MSNQLKAGLKKEWIFFWRSFRFGGMILLFLGCALFLPLLSGMMNIMGDVFDTVIESEGGMENIQGMEVLGDFDTSALFGMFTGSSGLLMSYIGSIEMFVSASLGSIPIAAMVILILLSGTAGAEQKKRSIIIPQTAGLTPAGYVLPKFILYPPLIFIATMLSMFLVNAVCHLVFKMSYPIEVVMLTGMLTGVSMVFMVCMYLFLGISLAHPGLSVIYVLAGNILFTTMITIVFEIERFTPWNLVNMSYAVVNNSHADVDIYSGVGAGNIAATVIITLVLCFMFMMFTLFSMIAKKMDNTADEVY